MPATTEIRTTIEQSTLVLEPNEISILQKKINMRDGFRFNMLNVDLFLDNIFVDVTGETWAGVVEIIVSPNQIIYTDMTIAGFANRTPAAGTDYVLFKGILNGGAREFNPIFEGTQFPNSFAEYQTDLAWYSPHLYITVVFHSTVNFTLVDLCLSFLFSVSNTKVPSLTSILGKFTERQALNIAAIASNGRLINPQYNVGMISPSWKWGGIRPSLMAKSDAFAEFFYRSATQEADKTLDTTQLRIFAKLARQMVPNPEPFGTPNTVKGSIPDWFRLSLNEGIEAGAVRPQWPPLKHNDNGNVLTF